MIVDNTKTVLAMDKIYFESPESWEEGLFDSTEYAMELDSRNPVLEGVCNRLGINNTEIKIIIKELNKRYRAIGIEEGVPKSVKNWLSGTPVNPAYRTNLYNLCLALELNLEETIEFFLKNYLTIPFNYKDRIDAIYFYGISNQLNYHTIKEMIIEFGDDDNQITKSDEKTEMIGGNIAEIDDLEIFKEYLKQHTYSKKDQYNTAVKEINDLIIENARYAEIERCLKPELKKAREDKEGNLGTVSSLFRNSDKDNNINIAGLLYIIYGYDNQDRYSSHKAKISKCESLPKAFRENFPNDIEISRIIRKEASPDVYRKAIIIMKFYNYFCSNLIMSIYGTDQVSDKLKKIMSIQEYRERDSEEIEKDLDDFYIETSNTLAKCGFVQMYARNPFDWLILYCAKSTDPLDAFRELLMQRYTDMDEV